MRPTSKKARLSAPRLRAQPLPSDHSQVTGANVPDDARVDRLAQGPRTTPCRPLLGVRRRDGKNGQVLNQVVEMRKAVATPAWRTFVFKANSQRMVDPQERKRFEDALAAGAFVRARLTSGVTVEGVLSVGYYGGSNPYPMVVEGGRNPVRIAHADVEMMDARPAAAGDPGAMALVGDLAGLKEYVARNPLGNTLVFFSPGSHHKTQAVATLLAFDPNPPTLTLQDDLGGVQHVPWSLVEKARLHVVLARGVLAQKAVSAQALPVEVGALLAQAQRDQDFATLSSQILANRTVFGGPEVYTFFERRPAEVPAFIHRWYGELPAEHVTCAVALSKRLPPAHAGLLLHPAIMKHVHAFETYYFEHAAFLAPLSALEVKDAFGQAAFPQRTVWRGLMLLGPAQAVRSEAKKVKTQAGLEPPSFRWPAHQMEMLGDWFHLDGNAVGRRKGSKGPFDGMAAHARGDTRQSALQSVSPNIAVAEMAAWDDLRRIPKPGTFVLFKVNISGLDLMELEGPYEKARGWEPGHTYRHGTFAMNCNDIRFEVLTDYISPGAIEEYFIYDNAPAGWSISNP